jgi:valyl-tRNA synthetase
LADDWIWAKLETLIRDVERLFQTFQYGEAGRQIYEFFWSDFADWYLEIAKEQLKREETRHATALSLARILDLSLKLLHPFTPFVTEELWGHLKEAMLASPLAEFTKEWKEALIISDFPEPREPNDGEESILADFALLQEIVRSIRNLRAEKSVAPSKRISAIFVAGDQAGLLQSQADTIAALAGLDPANLKISTTLSSKPDESAVLVVGSVEIYLPLAGMVDLDAEHARLSKELADAEVQIERLEKLLASDFASKAPEAVVAKEREKLAAFRETAEKLKAQLDG